MLKKTITYTDYNGVERTEDFYFNLTKSELMQWEYSVDGGLYDVLDKITKSVDSKKIIDYFKQIILRSYGEKSDDGKRFVKSEELSEAFSQTEAYDQLYMELFLNTDAQTEFVKGILPKDLGDDFKNELKRLNEADNSNQTNS